MRATNGRYLSLLYASFRWGQSERPLSHLFLLERGHNAYATLVLYQPPLVPLDRWRAQLCNYHAKLTYLRWGFFALFERGMLILYIDPKGPAGLVFENANQLTPLPCQACLTLMSAFSIFFYFLRVERGMVITLIPTSLDLLAMLV
jgi:hypothetical protein